MKMNERLTIDKNLEFPMIIFFLEQNKNLDPTSSRLKEVCLSAGEKLEYATEMRYPK